MNVRRKIKVLCVSDYYLPGFKGGGPIRTIANMCELLGGEFDFWIFTRDRDLGSKVSYPDINVDEWVDMSGVKMFYASPGSFGLFGFLRASKQGEFDLLYLNSFFSISASILLCIAAYGHLINLPPILLAPRGEFSPGALAIKPAKKKLYILFSRLFGVYKNIKFHASTKIEAVDIQNVLHNDIGTIYVAPDLVDVKMLQSSSTHEFGGDGLFRAIFVSRISPKKNLDGLLSILKMVKCNIQLNIYGPIEDEYYWSQCKSQINKLPDNVSVSYLGELNPTDVASTFAIHHVFIFPTHGENFGHVIFESLSAGTPVMISDNTPWIGDDKNAVTVIPNDMVDTWRDELEKFAKLSESAYQDRRFAAFQYVKNYIDHSNFLSDNSKMLRSIVSTKNTLTSYKGSV